ncbi:PKD domain-containing protein [Planctomycetota bacterium]
MSRRSTIQRVITFVFIIAILCFANSGLFAQGNRDAAFERVREVQQRHTEKLLAKEGIVGTAIGLDDENEPAMLVLLEHGSVKDIPEEIEKVKVKKIITGQIRALTDPTAKFDRPVPIGVSTGHFNITAGTIGCRVKDNAGNVFALSNNHVYADEGSAAIGHNVLQPGPYDGGINPDDKIGTLHAYEDIVFRTDASNVIDAAIAKTTTDDLGNSTPTDDGYGIPSATTVPATIGLYVQKYGRTTGLTHGQVSGINATVNVGYDSGTARFVNQILIGTRKFSSGGDSGSLIVTDNSDQNPVGLLFAGSRFVTVANPIDLVLQYFSVTVDDTTEPPANQPPVASFTHSTSNLEATFTDTSTDPDGDADIKTWYWSFGDSFTSTAQNPIHTYASPGSTYAVTLTVTDDAGAKGSISHNVTVTEQQQNIPPTASFTYSITDLSVDFTDTSSDSDGTLLSWDWNFGDSTIDGTSTKQNPSYTYAAPGTYAVTLIVADDDGDDDTATQEVTVTIPEPSPNIAIDSITPDRLPSPSGSNLVTISGSGFVEGASVTFENGAGPTPQASNVQVSSNAITLTITVKSGPRDRVWDVRVTNPDGSSAVVVDGLTVARR